MQSNNANMPQTRHIRYNQILITTIHDVIVCV